MEEKKRYSDEELEEFRAIINQKLEIAKSDYEETMKVLMNKNTASLYASCCSGVAFFTAAIDIATW